MPDPSFKITFASAAVKDLHQRLAHTRWSDAVIGDWSQGTNRAFLQSLSRYWHDAYDVNAAESRLNEWPQFRADIGGFHVHYCLLKGRAPNPTPLLLLNGWPSSFVEFRKLAPMLADPGGHGASPLDGFDVVMPALPGFGFSDRPAHAGEIWPEVLFDALMNEHLGYEHYLVSGTDIGAGVARRLAIAHPERVLGIHVSAVADPVLGPGSPPLTLAETAYKAQAAKWEAEEGAYEHVHYTRPQTLAYALNDSPVGLASWIIEKFYAWSDHRADLLETFPADMLIDNLMIYWCTQTIGSSMRNYYEAAHFRSPPTAKDRVTIATAVCLWPHDLVRPPREWVERSYDVSRYTLQPHGGHFPAWEAPNLYAADLRAFARSLR